MDGGYLVAANAPLVGVEDADWNEAVALSATVPGTGAVK